MSAITTTRPLLLLTFSAASFFTGAAAWADYPAEVLSENPLAYYRFSDGLAAPAPDLAPNLGSLGAAGNGTYAATVTHSVPGALAGSADTATTFANGGFVVPYTAGLNNDGSFTVEMWLQPSTIPAAGALICPTASMHVADPRAGWLIYQGDAATGWNFRTYNQNGTATAASISSAAPLTAGSWYHVVAVWDATTGTATLYVNGALAATSPSGLTYVPNGDAPFSLGSRSDNAFGWQGSIDEPAYYNKVLSPARILAHYNNGKNTAPATTYQSEVLADTPVGYWRLGEGAFTPAKAANAGSLGVAAAGNYYGGAKDNTTGPAPDAGFLGFGANNSSLALNGTDAYVGTGLSLLNDRKAYTVMGWVKKGDVHSTRGGYFGQNDLLEFGDSNATTIEAYIGAVPASLTTPFTAEDGKWQFLTLTGDATQSVLYLDGEPTNTQLSDKPNGFGTSTFKFNIGGGGVFNVSGDFFRGEIDEVAVLDKALSANRVKILYNAAQGNIPPSFVTDSPLLSPEPPTEIFATTPFTLTADNTGTPPFTYEWKRNGTVIPGAVSATYTVASASTADSGNYTVKVTNGFGSATTGTATTVTVNPALAPTFVTPLAPRSTFSGGNFVFSPEIGGTGPFTYQWFLNGSPIAGATSATYSVAASAATQGNYSVKVTNVVSSITSTPVAATSVVPTAGSYDELLMSYGPESYWKFEETTVGGNPPTTAFDSAGGHDALYVGGVLAGVTQAPRPAGGFPGMSASNLAADFDGSTGYVQGPAGLMNGRTSYTLAGWVRRTALADHSTSFFGQNDKVEFGYSSNTSIGAWTGDGIGGFSTLPDESWGFVSLTADSVANTRNIYLDGRLIGTGAYSTVKDSPDSFAIGGGAWNALAAANDLFTGQIDEVALFNKSLSSSQILSLYLRATGLTVTPPVVKALPGGTGPVALAAETFDATDGGFTFETPNPSDQTDWAYGDGIWRSNGQADAFGSDNTSFLTSPSYTVTKAGVLSLTFSHHYSFEQGRYDGGAVAFSVNGGDFIQMTASAFSAGAYNGVVLGGSSDRLAGSQAFVENSAGHPAFITSTCVLGYAAAGNKVRVRFISSSDNNTSGNLTPQGWEITSMSLSQGGSGAATVTWPIGAIQQSADLVSPWTDVVGTGPLTIDTTVYPRLFFRIKP